MVKPAHYIVFHPDSKRYQASVQATALIDRATLVSWTGKVRLDKPPGNEDPFVLGSSWVYSYCHATQLRREPKSSGEFLSAGSCILFCSGDLGDRGVLAVDTVFWIAKAHEWKSRKSPPDRYSKDVMDRNDIWRFHLRFGGIPKGHKGKYTYEAALHPRQGNEYSRLPLSAEGERVEISLDELPNRLRGTICEKLSGKRPVPLSSADLAVILGSVDARTAVAIVGDIRATDPKFFTMRSEIEIDCNHRQPKKC